MTQDGYLLLVEDNPGDARLTQSLLQEDRRADQPVMRWVQSVAQAVETLSSAPDCQAVLLDLGLPDSAGLEGLGALKALATDFPIIVLTGDGSEALGADAVAAGAQDFLVKGSFDAAQLMRCIRFATHRKRLERREIDRQRQTALREAVAARDLMHEVLERIGDAFVALDRDWRYTYANPQAARMIGCDGPDKMIGRTVWEMVPGIEDHPFADAMRHAMKTQESVVTEVYFEPMDRWFEGRIHPSPAGLTVYTSETSARHLAELAMVGLQHELSQLAQRLLSQERTTTQRVAQALHDNLGQTLAVARLNLEACVRVHAPSMPPDLKTQGERIAALLDQAVREVRHVLGDLRPPLLEEQGLEAALDNEIQLRSSGGSQVDVLLELAEGLDGQRWPAEVEYAAFMVAREAVANALLHAGASLVRVLLDGHAGLLQLDVVDDGSGIPSPMVRGRPGHLGIVGMRERCLAIGAGFTATAEAAGGTRISLHWEAPS